MTKPKKTMTTQLQELTPEIRKAISQDNAIMKVVEFHLLYEREVAILDVKGYGMYELTVTHWLLNFRSNFSFLTDNNFEAFKQEFTDWHSKHAGFRKWQAKFCQKKPSQLSLFN